MVDAIFQFDQNHPFVSQRWAHSEPGHDFDISVESKTLRGGLCEGVQIIQAKAGPTEVSIVLSRGGGLCELKFKDVSVGWNSPIQGPVHPSFVPLYRPDGLGWLAGFDEVMARCGMLNVGGPEFNQKNQLVLPLHGAIAYQPCVSAKVFLDRSNKALHIETVAQETLFHFYSLQLRSRFSLFWDKAMVCVEDEIVNVGGRPAGAMMLQHWNFGPPIAEGDSKLTVGFHEVAPRNRHAAASVANWNVLDPPTAGAEETVYFFNPIADSDGIAHAMLENASGDHAVSVDWQVAGMPCLTVWKNPVATEDGYALGIEPGTCFPNGNQFEKGAKRLIELQPGQSHRCLVNVSGIINDAHQVAIKRDQIQHLAENMDCVTYVVPQSQFGPV